MPFTNNAVARIMLTLDPPPAVPVPPPTAAKWMDFVYDPAQAAQITASVQFISPAKGVEERPWSTRPHPPIGDA